MTKLPTRLRTVLSSLPVPLKLAGAHCLNWAQTAWRQFARAATTTALTIRRAQRNRKLESWRVECMPVTLFLAPEAGLEPYFAVHSILAKSLLEIGEPALMLSCHGALRICPVKFANRSPPTKGSDGAKAICKGCRQSALSVGARYGLVDVAIEDLLERSDRAAIDCVMARYQAAPWELVHDGIEFGLAAFGEVQRDRRKLSPEEFNEDDLGLLDATIYSSLVIYACVAKLVATYNVRRIAYYVDYAYWIAPQVIARRNGIGLSYLEHAYQRDIDRRHFAIRPGNASLHIWSLVNSWDQYRARAIPPSIVAAIADSALYRLSGHGGVSTYSPDWEVAETDVLGKLGLSPKKRTLVAYTSSSDELFCVKAFTQALGENYNDDECPFRDQIDWLSALTKWVGARDELQLIVRLHPRMAASTRHANVSNEYASMLRALANLPSNIVVIAPQDRMSSYNLAECANVAIVAWSNIGLELARFGVPVVAAFPRVAPYPMNRFAGYGPTPERWFETVETALDQPATLERITEALRWTHRAHWSTTLDMSDVVPTQSYPCVPPWRLPKNIETVRKVMIDGYELSALNMDRLPEGADANVAERKAVLQAVDRMIGIFASGEDRPGASVRIMESKSDDHVAIELDGVFYERRSILARRLANMISDPLATTFSEADSQSLAPTEAWHA